MRSKPAASRQSSARSPAPPSAWPAGSPVRGAWSGSPLRGAWLAELTRIVWVTRWPSWVFGPFNKAGPGAQPLTLPQGERSVSVRLPPQAPPWSDDKGSAAESCRGHLACNEACIRIAPVALDRSRLAPHGAWARGRAGDPSARPRPDAGDADRRLKPRFGTRTSTTRACRPCAPRATRSPSQLQGAIAELTPRLADSAKRLDELTPKSGQPAPDDATSPPRISRTRSRGTTGSTPTCAPRAPCCWRPTTSARASARRGVNCSRNERSPARPAFSIRSFGPRSDGKLPVDAEVVRSLIDNWLGAIGERPLLAKIGMAAIVIALALAAAPLGWIAAPICLSGSRARRRQADCAARLPPPGHL